MVVVCIEYYVPNFILVNIGYMHSLINLKSDIGMECLKLLFLNQHHHHHRGLHMPHCWAQASSYDLRKGAVLLRADPVRIGDFTYIFEFLLRCVNDCFSIAKHNCPFKHVHVLYLLENKHLRY